MGIQEAGVSNHKDKSVPATCAHNTQRKPIDSIWTSPGLDVLQCGFLPFHDYYGFDSDHRLIWVEIYNQTLYGHRPQHVFRAASTRVKSNKSLMSDKGSDPTGLGRWTWVCIEGKSGEATVFVSVYRPCKNTSGTLTVWNQQV